MSRILLIAAALGLTLSGAGACEFSRSASKAVDTMTVASINAPEVQSTPAATVPAAPTLDTAAPDDAEG